VGSGAHPHPLWLNILLPAFAVALTIIVVSLIREAQEGSPRDPNSGGTARRVSVARAVLWQGMGGLWVLDGLLQWQPAMFSRSFIERFLLPVAQGQPAWLHALLLWGAHVWNQAPAWSDAAAGFVQVLIGVGLLAGASRPL
jgi:hypothetical protein